MNSDYQSRELLTEFPKIDWQSLTTSTLHRKKIENAALFLPSTMTRRVPYTCTLHVGKILFMLIQIFSTERGIIDRDPGIWLTVLQYSLLLSLTALFYFITFISDLNGCDNEIIGSWKTEEINIPSSSAREARLFSTNTQATQWREGIIIGFYHFKMFIHCVQMFIFLS